jgi:hypothetical protein
MYLKDIIGIQDLDLIRFNKNEVTINLYYTNLINNNGSSIVEAMNINQARIVSSAGPNNAGNRQTHC